jgi:hypothetical protein
MKRLKSPLMSLLLTLFIIHSFFKNENVIFISWYLNINLQQKKTTKIDQICLK